MEETYIVRIYRKEKVCEGDKCNVQKWMMTGTVENTQNQVKHRFCTAEELWAALCSDTNTVKREV